MTSTQLIRFILLFFLATSGAAHAEENAPFGLKWGMSKSDLLQLGVTVKAETDTSKGKVLVVENLPKILGDIGLVGIWFGFNDKLYRIAASSKDFDNDPYGSRIRSRYDELAKLLEAKYGKPDVHHSSGDSVWSDEEHFLFAINSGRRWHYSNYKSGSIEVQISIKSKGPSTGYYVLIYEDGALAQDAVSQEKKNEKNAL